MKISEMLSPELVKEMYRDDRVIKPECIPEYTDPLYSDLMTCLAYLEWTDSYRGFENLTIPELNAILKKEYPEYTELQCTIKTNKRILLAKITRKRQ